MAKSPNSVQERLGGELFALKIRKNQKKEFFFKKQSGRVIENKGKWLKTNRKQTGNEATEVVENKRMAEKTKRKQTEKQGGPSC